MYAAHQLRHQIGSDGVDDAQTQRTGQGVAALCGAFAQLVAASEDLFGFFDDGRARGGERHIVAAALEDLDLQFIFEFFYGNRQGRLRDVAILSRATEMTFAGYGQNVAKFVECHRNFPLQSDCVG